MKKEFPFWEALFLCLCEKDKEGGLRATFFCWIASWGSDFPGLHAFLQEVKRSNVLYRHFYVGQACLTLTARGGLSALMCPRTVCGGGGCA